MYKRLIDLFLLFLQGSQDALKFHKTFIFFLSSTVLRRKSLQCFFLNGVLFAGSVILYTYILQPVVSSFLPSIADEDQVETAERAFGLGFQVFWIIPIYLISFTVNGLWYNQIADASFILHYQTKKKPKGKGSVRDFFRSVSEEVYRAILTVSYMIVMNAAGLVPYIGKAFSFIFLSWLYCLYAFEYKWNKEKWTVEQKLSYLEQHAIYFAGFGCPVAGITVIFPKYINNGFFAMMFPLFLLLTTTTNPETCGIKDQRLPIFWGARKINLLIIKFLSSTKGRKER